MLVFPYRPYERLMDVRSVFLFSEAETGKEIKKRSITLPRLTREKRYSIFYIFSILTAQTFISGILATGSKAVWVSRLAAASA